MELNLITKMEESELNLKSMFHHLLDYLKQH